MRLWNLWQWIDGHIFQRDRKCPPHPKNLRNSLVECLRFFVSGQTWACGLLASEAVAHNLKGERAPVALCREPTEASAETVGSNPAPATTSRQTLVVRRIFLRKMRLHRSGCRSSPQKVSLHLHCSLASALTTFRLATNFLRIFPTFPQPGTGRARCPACSSFSQPPRAGDIYTPFPSVGFAIF